MNDECPLLATWPITGIIVILCDSSDVGMTKDAISAHICKYRFRLCNRLLACVQLVNRNLNRNIFVLNRNPFPRYWLQVGQNRSDTADPE
jgi:hypothetical protein